MIDWEEASKEANREQLAALSGNNESNEEVQRQLKDMQDALDREKEAKEREIQE